MELVGPPTPFEVRFTPQVQKWLRKNRGIAADVFSQAIQLRVEPLKGEPFTGDLVPSRALKFSLAQGGEYRIAYIFRPALKRSVVWLIGPRENFYRTVSEVYKRFLQGLEDE